MLHEDRLRAGSFGDDAALYDKVRPTYPAALIEQLLAGHPADVLDVGCGTGIAGRLLLARGCNVLGVEPDDRMAAVARTHGLTVESGQPFEAWDPAGRTFDLLVSGQAWHWVDPDLGPPKAAEVLRPDGRIALFWNHGRYRDELKGQIEAAYERTAPHLIGNSIAVTPVPTDGFPSLAAVLNASEFFSGTTATSYAWSHTYSREEWLAQLETHSDHRVLPPESRAAVLDAVAEVIDEHGGKVEVPYECWLVSGVRTRRR
jgi:SAM-dependent methyltransferase